MIGKLVAGIFSVLAGVIVLGGVASASSVYDSVMQTTNTLNLVSYNGSHQLNMSTNYGSYIKAWCSPSIYNSFQNTISSSNGHWAISTLQPYLPNNYTEVRISWVSNSSASTTFSPDSGGYGIFALPQGNVISLYLEDNGDGECYSFGGSAQHVLSHTVGTSPKLFLSSYPAAYPANYEGPQVPEPNLLTDSDEDGLAVGYETAQGTSDTNDDTDGDGITDFKESVWFEDRDDIFCGVPQCTYPDPTEKDLYVEIDWMRDGSTTYKPTTTQLDLVQDALDAKDINVHFDTGQYGGGNELPVYISQLEFAPTTEETDFFNLKNGDETYSPNFAEDRRGIWRYMITGYKLYVEESNAYSGAAYPSDDDAIIAMGRIEELVPADDTAVAGTIMHELGHNLCLADITYTGQNSSCFFDGIHGHLGNDYPSSMNYDKQFYMVGFSSGLNVSNDHDDWSAVMVGMDDFVTLGADPMEGLLRGGRIFDKQPLF